MNGTGCEYHSYLGIPSLLTAGHQVLPTDADASLQAGELHFRRMHMHSELTLAQILADLDAATEALQPPHNSSRAHAHLTRAAALTELLQHSLALLEPPYFSADQFAAFRELLGGASGAQSRQFLHVRRALGLEDSTSPIYTAFCTAVVATATTLHHVTRTSEHDLHGIAQALLRISRAYCDWQNRHMLVATLLIGEHTSGTAGTAGVSYLKERMAAPFPELWESATPRAQ